MTKISDKLDIDDLCKLLDVQTLDEYQDWLYAYNPGMYAEYYTEALSEGLSEADAEKQALECEQTDFDGILGTHKRAVIAASEKLFKEHGLELRELKKGGWKVAPIVSWRTACKAIIETINGAGPFYFHDVGEFLRSGPYTPKQAVIEHLHWIPKWTEVYEGFKAKRLVEMAMR